MAPPNRSLLTACTTSRLLPGLPPVCTGCAQTTLPEKLHDLLGADGTGCLLACLWAAANMMPQGGAVSAADVIICSNYTVLFPTNYLYEQNMHTGGRTSKFQVIWGVTVYAQNIFTACIACARSGRQCASSGNKTARCHSVPLLRCRVESQRLQKQLITPHRPVRRWVAAHRQQSHRCGQVKLVKL